MAKLFFSYSHKDEALRDALEMHLAMLKREGLIEALHDRRIVAGEPLDDAIDAYLETADVILCLLSPDFIDSEYCYSREMGRALERHANGEAVVIPVILRHCDWQHTPLRELRGTPRDNKPVKAWSDVDEALHDVATDVRKALQARGTEPTPLTGFPTAPATPAQSSIRPVPRSSNLHVPRVLTDKDRDDFIESSFEFVAEFFSNSLAELEKRHPDISGKLTRLDARRFTATLYRGGSKASAITVYMGAAFGHSRGISYNNDDRGQTNSSNGSFDLPSRGDRLRFTSMFQRSGLDRTEFDHEEVAEAVWASFVEPLQR